MLSAPVKDKSIKQSVPTHMKNVILHKYADKLVIISSCMLHIPTEIMCSPLKFELRIIIHPLFISALSIKYVRLSQRGQQAVKHIKWTLGPGELSGIIMWPLCKVCSIENTFYVQDNRCKAVHWLPGCGPGKFSNEVMLLECTFFFIFTGSAFRGETLFC